MLRPPKTKTEASKIRYGTWAGNEKGHRYDPERCAYEVMQWNDLFSQCSRKPGYGPDSLYCKQHAKIVKKKEEYTKISRGEL